MIPLKPLLIAFGLLVATSSYATTTPTDDQLQYDAQLSNYIYPFPVETFTFTSQRQTLNMAYMYLPAAENQPTVLLLHGKNFASDYWQDTALYLHQQGYGVLMPDQIGLCRK